MLASLALLPDPELVRRIRDGDAVAYEALFRAYHARLCAFAASLTGSSETAEELVQDVFAAIWTNRMRWEVRSSVRAYLYGAVRNRATSRGRRRALERRWLSLLRGGEDPGLVQEPADPGSLAESADRSRRLLRAMDALPERARLAVTLRWMHGLRVAEVAESMGITPKGAEKLLARALRTLREQFPDTFE